MIEMTNDKPMPTWRNFAAWSALGAIFCLLVMWGATTLLHEDGIAATVRSRGVAATVGLALIFSSVVVGFSGRKRPVSLPSVRNFVILNAAVVVLFLLAVWGLSALGGGDALGAMGPSRQAAASVGMVIIVFAFLGMFALWNANTGERFMDLEADAAEDLRERGRLILCSLVWMVASGLLLVILSLAGPGGVLSSAAALAGALLLLAVTSAMGVATWRLSDELGRTLAHEAGNMAFYLIQIFGGGWAMLAHLGFVAAPAALDWLTLFTVLMFVASFIAAGRRKLLKL
jgi:hypothetical protein